MGTSENAEALEGIFARPRFICLIGIDGSGKTTQAKRLAEEAAESLHPPKYVWCRSARWISGYLIRLAKATAKRRVGAAGRSADQMVKSRVFRRRWIAVLYTHLTFLEYWFQALCCIGLRKLAGRSLICDRYVGDAVADLVYNYGCDRDGIAKMLRNPILRMYPRPDQTVYLRISAETSASRKDDPNVPSIEYLRERVWVYDTLAELQGYAVVNGEQPPEEVYQDILRALEARLGSAGGGR